jgi:hypothetical protein
MTRIQRLSPDAVEFGQSLAALEPGPIPAASAAEVLERLDRVWFWLGWHGGGPRMPSSLPFGEATDLHWDPPVLSFQLVRRGTKYEKLERWRIDTGTWRRGFTVLERHEYVPEPTPAELAADAMAAELAPLIASRQPDPRLHWTKAGRVRVRIRRIFDVRTNRQSTWWRAKLDSRIGRHLPRRKWRLRNNGWWEPAGFWRTPAGRRWTARQLARAIVSRRWDDRLVWVDRSTVKVHFTRVPGSPRTNIPPGWCEELLGDIARKLGRSGWVLRDQESFAFQPPAGVVGWLQSYRGVGLVSLCLACGPGSPPGSGQPIHIDTVRPQGQSCHRCGRVMVTPVLDGLPERYGRRW